MELKKYLDENVNLMKQLRFLRFVVFLLAVAILVNGFFVYSSGVYEKVILIPPYLEGEAYITGKDASDSYLQCMADYVCFARLNYTPANVSRQFNTFLKLLDSSIYKKYVDSLYRQKENILQLQVSSAFYPTKIRIDREKKTIFVTGFLNQWTYNKEFITSEERVYALKYRIANGRFYVTDFIGCGKSESECEGKTGKEEKF